MRFCFVQRQQTGVTLKRVVLCRTLEVQHISLMECMESCGAPMSTTGTPRRAARMGPMVVPQGLSLRTITSCRRRGHRSNCWKTITNEKNKHISVPQSAYLPPSGGLETLQCLLTLNRDSSAAKPYYSEACKQDSRIISSSHKY